LACVSTERARRTMTADGTHVTGRALARGALFHYGRLLANGPRTLREVRAALDARPDERVLDLGCGSGGFCLAVPGEYVGIDPDPEASNGLQAFLLAHDRGDFIRPRARQRALLAGHFAVVREGRFRNSVHTLVQTLFVCEPRVS